MYLTQCWVAGTFFHRLPAFSRLPLKKAGIPGAVLGVYRIRPPLKPAPALDPAPYNFLNCSGSLLKGPAPQL